MKGVSEGSLAIYKRHREEALLENLSWLESRAGSKIKNISGYNIADTFTRIQMINSDVDMYVANSEWPRIFVVALWDRILNHLPSLTNAWRQTVLTSAFGEADTTRFLPVLRQFGTEIIHPIVAHEIEEHYQNTNVMAAKGKEIKDCTSALLNGQKGRLFAMLKELSAFDADISTINAPSSPIEYERLCADKLNLSGWIARTTSSSGDQGIDIVAVKGGMKVVIQCKLYSRPVGNKAVQEIVGGRGFERADAAAVVSNAGFTRAAESLAFANGIALLHHDQLSHWADDVYAAFSPSLNPEGGR